MQLSGCGSWLEEIDVFENGDMVKVVSCSKYKDKYIGAIGTVEKTGFSSIGVRLKEYTNKNSGYGLFWFDKDELTRMKTKHKEEYFMDKNYNPIIINFISGSNTDVPYTYAAYEDYNEDDYVVVHTGHHGMAIAKVKAMGTEDDKVEYGHEIICKIDMTAYNDRKARAKRKAELKGKMEAKVKELQETAIFEMLAKEDAGLAEMLKEFKELG